MDASRGTVEEPDLARFGIPYDLGVNRVLDASRLRVREDACERERPGRGFAPVRGDRAVVRAIDIGDVEPPGGIRAGAQIIRCDRWMRFSSASEKILRPVSVH